eukprot:8878516-Pyramimonas_sp.AAC.3
MHGKSLRNTYHPVLLFHCSSGPPAPLTGQTPSETRSEKASRHSKIQFSHQFSTPAAHHMPAWSPRRLYLAVLHAAPFRGRSPRPTRAAWLCWCPAPRALGDGSAP